MTNKVRICKVGRLQANDRVKWRAIEEADDDNILLKDEIRDVFFLMISYLNSQVVSLCFSCTKL